MSRSPRLLGFLCVLALGLAGRNPLAAQTDGKDKPKEQPTPQAKAKDKNAEGKKAASPVQFSRRAAATPAEIDAWLREPVEVMFEDTPLQDAVGFIAQKTGTNIMIDEQALAEEGVAIDEPINRAGQPVAGARLLDRILPPLGLTWIVDDDLVKVTTLIAAEDILVTRTYPVGDLLEYAKKHRTEAAGEGPFSELQPVQFGVGGCGGFGASGYLPPISPDAPTWLISTLQNYTSGPWIPVDGTGGSISYVNNNLVIRQTHKVQTEIDQLLKALVQFTKREFPAKSVEIHPPYYATDEDQRVKKALVKVVSAKCKDMPIHEFLDEMGEKLGVPVNIDEPAWTEEGIAIDEPVNVDLKDMPAGSLLKVKLDPLGLTALVEDGQLYVTTNIAAEERLVTAVYDVRDLDQNKYRGQVLTNLLTNETSGPWINIDGTGGSVAAPLDGLLVVRQTQKVRNQVAGILADLRKEIQKTPAAQAEPAPPDPQKVTTKMYRMHFISDPESVQKALFALVEPKSWSGQGGEGNIVIIDHTLIVKNKNAVQDEVEEFLKKLHKADQPPYQGGSFGDGNGNIGGGGMGGGGFGGGGMGGGGAGGFFRVAPAKHPE